MRNKLKAKRRENSSLNQRGWRAERKIQREGEEYFDPATLQGDMSTLPVEVLRRQYVLMWQLLTAAEDAGDLKFEHGANTGEFDGITVQTACSGTDGPIIALQIFSEIAQELKKRHPDECGDLWSFDFRHVMSCEITPFKQAYLVRNFSNVSKFISTKVCIFQCLAWYKLFDVFGMDRICNLRISKEIFISVRFFCPEQWV